MVLYFNVVFKNTAFGRDNTFYIRPSYPILLEKILQARFDTSVGSWHVSPKGLGVSVTGTPSIGKSVFLFYVADHFIKSNISFVATIGNDIYQYRAGTASIVVRSTPKEVQDILDNPDAVHLIDPEWPDAFRECIAFTVFFTSPTLANIGKYHMKRLRRLYMPIWSKHELEECYSSLSLCFAESNYMKWGGIMATSYEFSALEERLSEILQSKSLIDVLSINDPLVLSPEMEHHQWLLHRHPTDDYKNCHITLPSDYVRNKIIEVLESDVSFSLPLECNGILYGEIFEMKVLNEIDREKGIEVHLYDMKSCQFTQTQKLLVSATQLYSNAEIFEKPTVNTLYKPKENNKRGTDAVLITNEIGWVIQVIVNPKHKSLNITNAFKQFPSMKSWCVCCVIPNTILDKFHYPAVIIAMDSNRKSTYMKKENKYISNIKIQLQ